MADRFFPNTMPSFVDETTIEESFLEGAKDPLLELLYLPYGTVCEKLKRVAFDLKETIVKETWVCKRGRVSDYTVYTGALGTAFLLFKAYQVTRDKNDLVLCSDIIKACDSASRGSGHVTFICGQAGVYSLGAVVAKHNGDEQLCDHYLTKFKEIELPKDLPNELLYGRAGFLWACSFLNKNIGRETISPTQIRAVVAEVIKSGRKMGKGRCPLMYEWHGKRYWGAAHGLAGIMHVLMDMELKADEVEDVKATLHYIIRNRFPSGNYPSSEGSESDRLVHWCHGAPGVALTLIKAAKVFSNDEFLQAAVEAAEVIWNRGLLKRVGICHGKVEYLYKAKAFACFLHARAQALISEGVMHGGDRPYSLFEGIGGMSYLFFDMIDPMETRFPAYEL
ncbi:hypothetical protein KY290_032264 [Solanum tuberosum]|uniref:Abscisic acid ABA receptor n=1 Tax=Solanum tuberosum TaxID=4113 RepID=A0ABQ7UD71_SOLTU|nr:hypothetical protein KY290_032264 [Solanum tuberosum]